MGVVQASSVREGLATDASSYPPYKSGSVHALLLASVRHRSFLASYSLIPTALTELHRL
jgi:hypothetical protein